MVDGPTAATDFDRTETNRNLVRTFIETVPMAGEDRPASMPSSAATFTRNTTQMGSMASPPWSFSSRRGQGVQKQWSTATFTASSPRATSCLAVSEGTRSGLHSAFYDLYRIEADRIVEHWDTIETIAPPEEWKHDNGKF